MHSIKFKLVNKRKVLIKVLFFYFKQQIYFLVTWLCSLNAGNK